MSAPVYNTKYESGSHNDRYYTTHNYHTHNHEYITYRSKNNYYSTNVQVKRSSKTGGYFLNSLSGVQSFYNRLFGFGNGLTILRIFILVLFLSNFVRIIFEDDPLSFTGMLYGISKIHMVDLSWIKALSGWIRSTLINNVMGITSWGGVLLKLVGFLIIPLPSILYTFMGILNVILFLLQFLVVLFGGTIFL